MLWILLYIEKHRLLSIRINVTKNIFKLPKKGTPMHWRQLYFVNWKENICRTKLLMTLWFSLAWIHHQTIQNDLQKYLNDRLIS